MYSIEDAEDCGFSRATEKIFNSCRRWTGIPFEYMIERSPQLRTLKNGIPYLRALLFSTWKSIALVSSDPPLLKNPGG